MSRFRNGIAAFCSGAYVVYLKLKGINIHVHKINLVNPKSSIRTVNGGNIEIGFRSCISPNTEIIAQGGVVHIGNKCFVNRNCIIAAHNRINIEDNVTIGPGTYIYDHDHDGKGGYVAEPITIKKDAWLGAGCIILKGVTIGEGAVVAAGSVVAKDVPERKIVLQKRKTEYISREI